MQALQPMQRKCYNCHHLGIDGALMACKFIKGDIQHVSSNNVCNQWKREVN